MMEYSYVEESTYIIEFSFTSEQDKRIRARLEREHPGHYGAKE